MKYLLILAALIITLNVSAQLTLPSVFSDNMVLQRDAKIPVWGRSAPEAKVTVSFHGQKKVVTADKEGNWKVYLSPVSVDANQQENPPAPFKKGGLNPPESPFKKGELTIESGDSKIIIKNVLVGEVWLCSGQSNMGFKLKADLEAEKYIAEAKDSRIRFFKMDKYNFKPYECDNCIGDWKVCTTNSVENVTAVGYFFGLELLKKLDVPVGLMQIEFGGTIVESWMNSTDLHKWEEYKKALNSLAKYKNSKTFFRLRKKEKKEWFDELKKIDPGFKNNWMAQDINDAGWEKVNLPRAWDTKYLKGHTGIVWYRKKIYIPANWNQKDIVVNLGSIRGYDITWLNGKEIGSALEHYASRWSRVYNVPGNNFTTGENTIVICNFSGNGSGGPRGPLSSMKIFQKTAPSNVIHITSNWLCKKGYEGKEFPDIPASVSFGQNTLSVHYNSRIYPTIPYAIRGVIWYQGESNRHNSERYEDLFTTMIKSWRKEWDQGDFPFYFVQIAPFKYGKKYNSAFIQEAQFNTLKLTNTGMAVTMDISEINNIHPRNKKDVGYRLALWALAKDYGFTNIVFSGPLYKNYKIEGNKIIISFDHSKGLKTRDGEPLSYFEIASDDKIFYPATAEIIDDKITVSSDKVNDPIAVRFAWSNTAEPNLCNAADLPAPSFRTDNWESEAGK